MQKKYDLVIIGTGSAMNIAEPYLAEHPGAKVAVIDKDPPGGICLTKGCIPTKMLVYPAEVIRQLDDAEALGIQVKIEKIDFNRIMDRMRKAVYPEIESIRNALSQSQDIDYYPDPAEFTGPYRLTVAGQEITAGTIFLCLGSRPKIPEIRGLNQVRFYTSDTILDLDRLPADITIVGGGYIAAEYGHFFSAMGAKVTIIGRNTRFLPEEEPEISQVANSHMKRHMTIINGHEVVSVEPVESDKKRIVARNVKTDKSISIETDDILIATGRTSNTDFLHPERSGIEIDKAGWIIVNEYLETTKPGIWALGDTTGKHMFKHVGNYESRVVYYNAVLKEKMKVDYRAVPHAVFTHPEIASVGMTQAEAIQSLGSDNIIIGFNEYENTARGEAMAARDYFVKVIVQQGSGMILGAHIIGPQASILIQEIVTLMYTKEKTVFPITTGMHIHPALSEVVKDAFFNLMPANDYNNMLRDKVREAR